LPSKNEDPTIRCMTGKDAKRELLRHFLATLAYRCRKVVHGAPIDAVLLFPNNTLLATAGGTAIKIWDMAAGGRLLAKVSQHHKNITSLTFCSDYKRLLSGGLDKHVKVYDVTSYKVVHTLSYAAPVLGVAVSPDDNMLAVGMGGQGGLSIQRRRPNKPEYRKRTIPVDTGLSKTAYEQSDLIVKSDEQEGNLKRYDHLLKNFQHSKALTCLLQSTYWSERRPEVVVSFLKELGRRGALETALAGRDHSSLRPLLKFLRKNLNKQRFVKILLGTTHVLLRLYQSKWNELHPKVREEFEKLSKQVDLEIEQEKMMNQIVGAVDLVIGHAQNSIPRLASSSIFGQPKIERLLSSSDVHITGDMKESNES